MHKNTAANEVIRRLNTYYDVNNLIDEELKTIRYAEKQRNAISLSSQQLTGLPGGKGQHSDPVCHAVTSSTAKYYDDEIQACSKRIAVLRLERDWCTAQLATLDRMEQRLIELAYLGPKDPEARRSWLQRPTWYSIAAELGTSETYARVQASRIILRFAEQIDQIPLSL